MFSDAKSIKRSYNPATKNARAKNSISFFTFYFNFTSWLIIIIIILGFLRKFVWVDFFEFYIPSKQVYIYTHPGAVSFLVYMD